METAFIIGRVLFAAFFLFNAYGHLVNHKGASGYAKMKGVPMPGLAVAVTGLMLLFGGVSVLFAWHVRYGLAAIVAFLIPVTLAMHQFWKEKDPMTKSSERIAFFKNAALLGATLMLFSFPW